MNELARTAIDTSIRKGKCFHLTTASLETTTQIHYEGDVKRAYWDTVASLEAAAIEWAVVMGELVFHGFDQNHRPWCIAVARFTGRPEREGLLSSSEV